jgi:hypothetical protein
MPRRPTATSEQLGHDIDQGLSGDKVRGLDPAAVPLGTDEEAAGTPIDPHLVAVVRGRERKMRPQPARDGRVSQEMGRTVVAIYVAIVIGLSVGICSVLIWL